MFKGSIVALVTPFRDGKVDEKAYQTLIEWQISEGTDAVVPVGTTGESPTLQLQCQCRVQPSHPRPRLPPNFQPRSAPRLGRSTPATIAAEIFRSP